MKASENVAIDYLGGGVFGRRTERAVDPAADEVRVAVAFTGICGTDLKIAQGAMDARITSPWPIGHEMSGTVEAVGANVTGWRVDEPVTVMPLDWCDRCSACRRGHRHVCEQLRFVGIDAPGSLQQRWNVPARLLVRLPDGLPLEHAALAEPTAVAVHDLRRGGVLASDQVVVIGGGPIGLMIAIVARHVGADVLVSEVSPFRRDLATELGFRTLDPTRDDLVASVSDWTQGKGADVAFEVSGSAAGVQALTGVLAVRGRAVVVAIHTQPKPIDLMEVFWKELDVHGARVYERRDFDEAVTLLADGVIPAGSLITDIVPLSETEAAFERLASGEDVVKLLIDTR